MKNAQELQARAAADRWGVPVVTTGIETLLGLLYLWSGIEAFYRARIQALDPDAFVFGVTQEVDDRLGTKTTSAAGVNMWVKLHSEASSKLADIAEQCVRAGIDERKVRIEEARVNLLIAGLEWLVARLVTELLLSEAKVEVVHRLVEEMLRNQIPRIEGDTT